MSLHNAQIKLLGLDADMEKRLKELIKNPYLLDQMSSGCCSFAAINMVLLKYNKGDFLEKYLKSIIDIKKKDTDFLTAAKIRYHYFKPYGRRFDSATPEGRKKIHANKMDFFMNIGLLTLFKDEHEKNMNGETSEIWNNNIEYTKAFLSVTESYNTNSVKSFNENTSATFFLKKGDMANTWEGLKKTFELAVSKGSDGNKTVCFEKDAQILCEEEKFFTITSPDYEKRYSAVIKNCREWARKKKDTRFLIAGVFYFPVTKTMRDKMQTESIQAKTKQNQAQALYNQQPVPFYEKKLAQAQSKAAISFRNAHRSDSKFEITKQMFNKLENWGHINHYVVVPRLHSLHGTDIFASSGTKKHWGDAFIPIRILKAEIKDAGT